MTTHNPHRGNVPAMSNGKPRLVLSQNEWAALHDSLTLALDALGDKPSDVDFPFLMNLLMHQRAALRVSQTAKEWMERVFAK